MERRGYLFKNKYLFVLAEQKQKPILNIDVSREDFHKCPVKNGTQLSMRLKRLSRLLFLLLPGQLTGDSPEQYETKDYHRRRQQ